MNVVIKPKRQRFVKTKLKNGRFASANELVDYAIERLQLEDQDTARLIRSLKDSAAALRRGEETDWDLEEEKADLIRWHAKQKRK